MNAGIPLDRSVNAEGDAESNPIKKAFDDFRRTTPAVTKTIAITTVLSWLFGLMFLPKYALECIPYFIYRKFEIYRLLTSVLVNPDLFADLVACIMLAKHCGTLEESIGSAATLWLVLGVFTVLVNVLYCLVQVLLTSLRSDDAESAAVMYGYWESPGIWTGLLGIIAVEACRASAYQQQRTFCNCFKIPTKLFPLCLLFVVMIMNMRSRITLFIATGLGYFIGHNLDTMGVLGSPSCFVTYVDTRFRGSQGWIGTNASIGAEAWMRERELMFSGLPVVQGSCVSNQSTSTGELANLSGQALGGASQRNVDARTARLQALERQHVGA